jgi:hypothetical protein
MGLLLKIVLIFAGIYLIGKALFKGLLSYFLGNANDNMNEQLHKHQEEMARQKKQQEGRITINYEPQSDKHIGKDEGDYVDFEEVQ